MQSSKPLFIYLMDLYSPPKSKHSAVDTFDLALGNPRSKLRIKLVNGWNWREKEDASRLIGEGEQDPSRFSIVGQIDKCPTIHAL